MKQLYKTVSGLMSAISETVPSQQSGKSRDDDETIMVSAYQPINRAWRAEGIQKTITLYKNYVYQKTRALH